MQFQRLHRETNDDDWQRDIGLWINFRFRWRPQRERLTTYRVQRHARQVSNGGQPCRFLWDFDDETGRREGDRSRRAIVKRIVDSSTDE